jgi:hypothetical protein
MGGEHHSLQNDIVQRWSNTLTAVGWHVAESLIVNILSINGVYKSTRRFLGGDDNGVKAANVIVVKDGVQGGCLVICL